MRTKYLIVILVLVILLAGCGRDRSSIITISENPNAKKEVTSANDFQKMYRDWTARLIIVAEGTNQAYNSWSAGRISSDEFAAKTRELYKETKRLKTEISYNTVFNLNESDQELVYYDLVTGSYYVAIIHMNDFLALLPTMEDEQIKTSYEYINKIVSEETDTIKAHLEM